MLFSGERKQWQQQASAYADTTDLYNRFKVIVDVIETTWAKKKKMAQG